MDRDDIGTERLLLRRLSPQAVAAGLSGDAAAIEEYLGATVPPDLLLEPSVLHYALVQLEADAHYLPWSIRAILLRGSMQMIGHVRFHSRPDPPHLRGYGRNAVEFGYVVFSAYRRQGYAREALTGLLQWAQQTQGVHRFIASIAPDNVPSRTLIARLGFQKVGEAVDPVDGIEHVYLRDARGGA